MINSNKTICVFISDDISAKRRPDIEDPNFECLWFSLRPTRLPRPLSCIMHMVCVVYHPPGLSAKDHQDLNDYLVSTIDTLRNQYPDCGIVLLGDFNDFNISNLLACHSLKQVVDQPTRGTSILDLIITNLFHLYEKSHVLAPLGTSDHNSVRWSPRVNLRSKNHSQGTAKRPVRLFPRHAVNAFGRWVSTHNWFGGLDLINPSVDKLVSSFTADLTSAVDRFFPMKSMKFHHSDKPWITPSIKMLVKERKKAFHSQNTPLWKSLRNKVQQTMDR